jgi:hypothetical protein
MKFGTWRVTGREPDDAGAVLEGGSTVTTVNVGEMVGLTLNGALQSPILQGILVPAHPALCTLFPGSLTRKLYRKKIPENAGNVPEVPDFL